MRASRNVLVLLCQAGSWRSCISQDSRALVAGNKWRVQFTARGCESSGCRGGSGRQAAAALVAWYFCGPVQDHANKPL